MRRLMRAVRECWVEVSIAAALNGCALAGYGGSLVAWLAGFWALPTIALVLAAVFGDWLHERARCDATDSRTYRGRQQ